MSFGKYKSWNVDLQKEKPMPPPKKDLLKKLENLVGTRQKFFWRRNSNIAKKTMLWSTAICFVFALLYAFLPRDTSSPLTQILAVLMFTCFTTAYVSIFFLSNGAKKKERDVFKLTLLAHMKKDPEIAKIISPALQNILDNDLNPEWYENTQKILLLFDPSQEKSVTRDFEKFMRAHSASVPVRTAALPDAVLPIDILIEPETSDLVILESTKAVWRV